MRVAEIEKRLKLLGSATKALASRRFFKTNKGDYGEGDIFIGVTVPEQRKIAREYNFLSLKEIEKLLYNKIHEYRLTALLVLCYKYKTAQPEQQKKLFNFYIKHRNCVNNWDLVDTSAPCIVGAFLHNNKAERKILYKYAQSKSLWERRIAIISTYYLIQQHDFRDAIKIATILLRDTHDLIHKAVGWMLREVGKRDEVVLHHFLKKYASVMPRTMLRYAIEKLSPADKVRYMKKDIF